MRKQSYLFALTKQCCLPTAEDNEQVLVAQTRPIPPVPGVQVPDDEHTCPLYRHFVVGWLDGEVEGAKVGAMEGWTEGLGVRALVGRAMKKIQT